MKLIELLQSSPDGLVLVATLGLLLIYLELNRPGSIIPGAIGLLLLLLAVAALDNLPWRGVGAGLLIGSVLLQSLGLRYRVNWHGALVAGLASYVGCRELLKSEGGSRVSFFAAFLAASLLGPGTSLLTAIARRARTNKGLDF